MVLVHKVKIQILFLCVIFIFSVCSRELRQLAYPPSWCFFQWFLLCACANIYHVKVSCVNLSVGPNLAFCFWWNWAVDWWILKSSFQWWSLKMFSMGPWCLSLIVLPWALLSVLCCVVGDGEKCDFLAVPICKIFAYSANYFTFHWSRNIWV